MVAVKVLVVVVVVVMAKVVVVVWLALEQEECRYSQGFCKAIEVAILPYAASAPTNIVA